MKIPSRWKSDPRTLLAGIAIGANLTGVLWGCSLGIVEMAVACSCGVIGPALIEIYIEEWRK